MKSLSLKALTGAVGAAFGFFFGTPDQLLTIMLVLVAVNWLCLMLTSPKGKNLAAVTMQQVMLVVIVGVANMVTPVFGATVAGGVRDLVVYFVIANEVLSILVVAHTLGVPIPPVFLTILGTGTGPIGAALQAVEKTPAGANEVKELTDPAPAPAELSSMGTLSPVAETPKAPDPPAPAPAVVTETSPAPAVTNTQPAAEPVSLDPTVIAAIAQAVAQAVAQNK